MKHRWAGGPLLLAVLILGACAPTDAGADDATPSSPTELTEATGAPTTVPESGTPEPAEYEQDEY
jgi:hypothetical protein